MITRFHAGDEFKIIMDNDQQIAWYPDGEGNNYTITDSGVYIVYFRPNGNGEMTIVDATLIQRFEIGMSVKYPINEFV
jgi:hypothetical protein